MSEKKPDCIGPGIYYKLEHPEWSNMPAEPPTTRRSPLTGEVYSIDALRECLHSQDYYIRIRAASGLAAAGDVEAVPDLLYALADDHASVRKMGIEGLEALETPAVPLPCLILLSDCFTPARRAELLTELAHVRLKSGAPVGRSAEEYCQGVLDAADTSHSEEDRLLMASLKGRAAEVLKLIQDRRAGTTLLRAGGAHESSLLRASQSDKDPATEHLLKPSDKP